MLYTLPYLGMGFLGSSAKARSDGCQAILAPCFVKTDNYGSNTLAFVTVLYPNIKNHAPSQILTVSRLPTLILKALRFTRNPDSKQDSVYVSRSQT